jgi:hypothetical protein
MVRYGVGVAAPMARTRVPELIAEAFAPEAAAAATEQHPESEPGSGAAEPAARLESAS